MPAPDAVTELVQWFWIPEWDIEPGRTSRQHLIAFPACNLAIESNGVEFVGPTTRRSYRDLTGRGWAVGALLRPALVPMFTADPGRLRDSHESPVLTDLQRSVTAAMREEDPAQRRQAAVETFTDWLVEQRHEVTDDARLANTMIDVIGSSSDVTRINEVAGRLAVSSRTLQRLAKKYVGLSPTALIRRYRLQEAADRVRTDPQSDLAEIAAQLGYSDHAHLANDFRKVLGFTPSDYRRSTA